MFIVFQAVPKRVSLVVLVSPFARDILHPGLGEGSWTSSLEEASLVVVVSRIAFSLRRGGG